MKMMEFDLQPKGLLVVRVETTFFSGLLSIFLWSRA
jgi:hypothetical protein